MFGDPVLSALLDGHGLARLMFELLSIMLNLANLLDHACAEQRVFIEKSDAYQVVGILAATPGHYAGIARLFAQ